MIPINAFNVSILQVAKSNVLPVKIEGYIITSTGSSPLAWLQVHDNPFSPDTGDVPLKEWPVYPSSEFFKDFLRHELNCTIGCFVGLSSTEGTYTEDSTTKMDISVELSFPELTTGQSETSLSSNNELTVWVDNANHRLFRFEIFTNTSATDCYLMLFCNAAGDIVNGVKPFMEWKIPAGTTKVLDFGDQFIPQSGTSSAPLKNCTFALSDTPTSLTLHGAGDFTMNAIYK